jgi:putative colanic acid biosynthesis UDP-glucose lipid carrier transferase
VVGRRSLIELTREVCDCDGDLDLREDRFMLALALALRLEPAEIAHVVYDTPFRGVRRFIKRAEDLIVGFVCLALCALPMLLIALAIKLTSKGPVLFRQPRHGEDGVEFDVLKFRSMRVMETGDEVTQARRNDARVTKVGAFLRRTSLDELPQFFNVIAGDMSLVGPRPHAIAHNQLYRTKILEYMRRHKVKPGITGWAQVNGYRGETDTLDKMVARVEHDLAYIRGWSLWLDLKILFLTVFGRKVRQNAY